MYIFAYFEVWIVRIIYDEKNEIRVDIMLKDEKDDDMCDHEMRKIRGKR